MIKPTRAWLDSTGQFHASREDACKAEFRLLLIQKWPGSAHEAAIVSIDKLVDDMFEIDKMIGEACKEDTRADITVAEQAS